MKGFKLIFIIFLLHRATNAINFQNYFPQFQCSENYCEINDVSQNLQEIYNQLASYEFEYSSNNNNYNCRNYGRQYCQIMREKFEQYTELEFVNSQFEKFPSGDNQKFNHVKKLSAVAVELVELNRDDLKPFKSLEELDLSENNITKLNNLFLLHVTSLRVLNLKSNQIATIDTLAFDESNTNLNYLDLSFNKLTEINENLFDIIGKSEFSQLFLDNNEIAKIIPSTTAIESSREFEKLTLNNNKLKSFIYNCSKIDNLELDNNKLEKFEVGDCSVKNLNLNNNNLISLKISTVDDLKISNNIKLQELTLNAIDLKSLEMENLQNKLLSYDTLRNATKLTKLNAANTFLGPLKINTLAEMKSLQILNLSNTGLTHIEYGMFSHQRQVTVLDISGNELESIDINIEKSIEVEPPINPVKNSPNVLGIQCMTAAQSKIQTINVNEANETISKKLNEIIEQINEDKTKRENHKFDADVMKSEIFSIQKEILEIKTKIVKIEMNENLKHASSSNSSVDMNGIKNMMEQLNNITLDRQEIAYDQLVNKINEQGIEIKSLKIEIERSKNTAPMLLKTPEREQMFHPVHYANLNDVQNGTKTTEFLLIIVITSLFIIIAIFGYIKLKKSLHAQKNSMMRVRARSTNTMNTSIELPFDDDKN